MVRVLGERGRRHWEALEKTRLWREWTESGRLLPAEPTTRGGTLALHHPRLPFISYPYEWSFSMLRDAALLQLDLLEAALDEGLILKDATPYNIQFEGGRPTFIDIGSFQPYQRGEPWLGYRQFCRQFLYPLMMRAWVGIPFQPWLRGDPEGPTAGEMAALLKGRHRWRGGALFHVHLQGRAEQRMKGVAVRDNLAAAGFGADLILANVRRLRRLVEGLHWTPQGEWAGYQDCDHVGLHRQPKTEFLVRSLDPGKARRVVDLGANDGHFSRVARQAGAEVVIPVDGDESMIEQIYREGSFGVVTDLTNPTPSQGWAGVERPSLWERARPDFVIAYGIIHHLMYSASVPLGHILDWLRSLAPVAVVEFVAADDPMVGRLTANKRQSEIHPERDRAAFERLAGDTFVIVDSESLAGGTRFLYHLERR